MCASKLYVLEEKEGKGKEERDRGRARSAIPCSGRSSNLYNDGQFTAAKWVAIT